MDEALAGCLSLPETMSSFPELAQLCLPTGHLLQYTLSQYEAVGGGGGGGDGIWANKNEGAIMGCEGTGSLEGRVKSGRGNGAHCV